MLLSLVAFKGFNVPYEARADKIYMLLQRGDSVIAPNKHPNLRLWDGMVGYLDPREWQSKVVFSDYWLGEVCVVELPRSRKPMLIEANKSYESAILGPNGFPVTSDVTRRTRGYVDVQSLSPFVSTQIPDLMTRYYKHKTFMPVIDGGALPQSLLLDTKGVDFTKRPLRADVGQITIGNFTIGPVGADYIRYGGVGGAWTALGNLTGNLTFTLIGNILDNQGALAVINLGGFTLDNTSSNPHGGDPTAGWLITITAPATFFDMRQEGPGTFNMRNLRTVRPVGNFWDCVVQAIDNNHTINFHDLLVDHDGRGTDRYSREIFGWFLGGPEQQIYMKITVRIMHWVRGLMLETTVEYLEIIRPMIMVRILQMLVRHWDDIIFRVILQRRIQIGV
jgi:hypothetical protein